MARSMKGIPPPPPRTTAVSKLVLSRASQLTFIQRIYPWCSPSGVRIADQTNPLALQAAIERPPY